MGLARDKQRNTYADYLTWGEDARYELIDGIAYAMSPGPSRAHQEVLGQMYRQVADALDGSSCHAYIAPLDVRLPRSPSEDDTKIETVVQPDLFVVCSAEKLDDRGCRGAPDWVVEVLSPATAGHDQILKLRAYERAGVLEYWLVHPADRVVTVHRLQDGAYPRPEIHEMIGVLGVMVLPQIRIDWAGVLRDQPPAV